MKKIIAIGFVLLLILLAGCAKKEDMQAKTTEQAQEQVADAGEDKVTQVSKSQIKFNIEDAVEGKDTRVKIEGDEGEIIVQEIEPTMEAAAIEKTVDLGDDWCKEGAAWSFKSTAPDMAASGEWIIKGLMTSGEYSGLCHVEYRMQTAEGETTMDYYFAEDGESGYFEMKMPDGSAIKQEWTG
jgi:hypothetical protein